jgi:hypothetical protein
VDSVRIDLVVILLLVLVGLVLLLLFGVGMDTR